MPLQKSGKSAPAHYTIIYRVLFTVWPNLEKNKRYALTSLELASPNYHPLHSSELKVIRFAGSRIPDANVQILQNLVARNSQLLK
jgi:hypothetical protein